MRGLLAVSFGTSNEGARKKAIDAMEAELRAAFPDREFFSAWTSGRIVEKLRRERGEHHDTLEEAFARVDEAGVSELIIATTCLMKGAEMRKVSDAARAWEAAGATSGRTLGLAPPLLAGPADWKAVACAICDEHAGIPMDEALLLMGHGAQAAQTAQTAQAAQAHAGGHLGGAGNPNAVYTRIAEEFEALGRPNFFVATVEGEPSFDSVLPAVRASGARRVHLAPLMFVAGDHAVKDLAGDGDASWKSRLASEGFEPAVEMRGLGEYPAVRRLVCDHARDALAVLEVAQRG